MSAAALLAAAHYGGEGATWQERLARALAAPDALFAIAEVSGQVVAYAKAARCAPVDDDDAPAGLYLTGLLVDPAWRRRGLGEQLTRWRLERLRRSGEPVLFFTNARNTASLALHTRLGFVEVGRAASYLGEPFTGGVGVLMRWGPAGSSGRRPLAARLASQTSSSVRPAGTPGRRTESGPCS